MTAYTAILNGVRLADRIVNCRLRHAEVLLDFRKFFRSR